MFFSLCYRLKNPFKPSLSILSLHPRPSYCIIVAGLLISGGANKVDRETDKQTGRKTDRVDKHTVTLIYHINIKRYENMYYHE